MSSGARVDEVVELTGDDLVVELVEDDLVME